MKIDIQETFNRLRELGQKARPAPWSYLILPADIHTGAQDSVLLDGDGHGFATNAEDAFTRNDFDFMLEARNAIPVLLAEIERLTAENAKAWDDGYIHGQLSGIKTHRTGHVQPYKNPHKEDKK